MTGRLVVLCLMLAAASDAREATYWIRGRQLPVSVAANGYQQTVTPRGAGEAVVHVATGLAPIGGRGAYREVLETASPSIPSGFAVPRSLRAKWRPEREASEVATDTLKWAVENLRLQVDTGSQDAISVLRRRDGRCSGLANATAALLMAAGFEARTVSGLLVTERGAVPHRWVECRLPGAGWVPTDPTLGLWTVTPRHVAFADTVREPPQVRVVRPAEDVLALWPRWRGRPCRPNLGSELVCRLVGDDGSSQALAILYGSGGEVHRAVLAPEGRFQDLLPGSWRLVVVAEGTVVANQCLVLKPARSHSFAVVMPARRWDQEVES